MTERALLAGLVALLVAGCGGAVISSSEYMKLSDTQDPGDKAFWDAFGVGKRVVVHAKGASCSVLQAASLAELKTAPRAVSREAFGTPKVFSVHDARVKTGTDGWVALELEDAAHTRQWLRIPSGQSVDCVWPAPPDLDRAVALRGSTLRFAPWRATCVALEAVGQSPESTLIESDRGVPMDVGDFELGAADAVAFAAGKPGNALWLNVNNGSIKLRADVVQNCFEPITAADVAPGVAALLHVAPTRCSTSVDGGRDHVECRTSLGVWQGTIQGDALALTLTRRTLGPVHLLGGQPVNGSRYARAVVAVTKGQASSGRAKALYESLDRAVANAVAREAGGAVRIAEANAPDVTYRVHVDIGGINIGDLQQSETQEVSQYKVRDEERPNPEKPQAQARADRAHTALPDAERDYANELAAWEAAKQAAIDKCHEAANNMNDSDAKQWANTGCDAAQIAGQFVQPSHDSVDAARQEVADAESALASTPDTITVPIMADWPYKKKLYSRSTSATLTISMRPNDVQQPTVVSIPLSVAWNDYEVAADPAHNVTEHQPEQGPIGDPEALIPFVAEQASAALATRLRAAISNASIEQAMKAFIAAGNDPPKPGYEAVDAVAFDAAQSRLSRVVLRGKADLPAGGGAFALPSKAARLGPGECLLAVAVAPADAAIDLRMKTPNGSHGDLRGASLATVEVCRDEIGDHDAVDVLELSSKVGGAVRWGLYRTVTSPQPTAAGSTR